MSLIGMDFGTTASCLAVADGDRIELVSFGTAGNRYPSAVYAAQDGLLTGPAAVNSAGLDPSRFEPTPKRSLSRHETMLPIGDRPVSVVAAAGAVLAAILRPVATRTDVERFVVTHPAAWDDRQVEQLGAAVHEAHRRLRATGLDVRLPSPEPIAEPVAAAWMVVGPNARVPGSHHAIFDWGGGTFDAAIVTWTGDRFVLAGPPIGIDPLGGEDVDQALWDFLAGRVDPETWQQLNWSRDLVHRRAAATLRNDLRHAKHALSETVTTNVAVGNTTVSLTRAELEHLALPFVDRCVHATIECLHRAGVTPEQMTTINLTGDASRMPLVSQRLWTSLGTPAPPQLAADPKAAVAQGATAAVAHTATGARPLPVEATQPIPVEPTRSVTVLGPPVIPDRTLDGPHDVVVTGRRRSRGVLATKVASGVLAGMLAVATVAFVWLSRDNDDAQSATTSDGGETDPGTVATAITASATEPDPTTTTTDSTTTTSGPTTTTTTAVPLSGLGAMFPGVDFDQCARIPRAHARRCAFPQDGVVVEFFDWSPDSTHPGELEETVGYWAGFANSRGEWSVDSAPQGRFFEVRVAPPEGAETDGIFWTYDAEEFGAVAYPDADAGGTIADVNAWFLAFDGDGLSGTRDSTTEPTATTTSTTTLPAGDIGLRTMFPGIDIESCPRLRPNGRSCSDPDAPVVLELFDWSEDVAAFEQHVEYWAGSATSQGQWSVDGIEIGRYFDVQVTPEGGTSVAGVFWTYDEQGFSVLAYPDGGRGGTIEDVEALFRAFDGHDL